MASRAQRSPKKSGRSGTKSTRKTNTGQASGRSAPKRSSKATAADRGKRAPARNSASQGSKSRKAAPSPARDVHEEAGATVYPERSDVPHPGVIGENERINAEDHSSPRSRLADGSESVVRHPEE